MNYQIIKEIAGKTVNGNCASINDVNVIMFPSVDSEKFSELITRTKEQTNVGVVSFIHE